jgi:transcriptional regulator with XRE-family HTH domain
MTTTEQGRARQMADRNLAEIEIGELRAALEITQADLAGKLKVTQAAVSRLEGRSDWHLSTLLANTLRRLGAKWKFAPFPRENRYDSRMRRRLLQPKLRAGDSPDNLTLAF